MFVSTDIATEYRGPTHYVGFPVTARFSEFGAAEGPNNLIPQVYQWLTDHDITPSGGPLYIYWRFGADHDEPVDLIVAVPIPGPVEPSRGLITGQLPAGIYIVDRFVGHPDGVSVRQPVVRKWAHERGLSLSNPNDADGERWTGYAEHYLTDPAEEPDPSQWTTELLFLTD